MYRRILVPLDGSLLAEKVLPTVEALALQFSSLVILLRVLEPVAVPMVIADSQMSAYVEDAELRQQACARVYLNRHCLELRKRGIDVRKRLGYGTAAATIREIGDEEHVDLIAMATHGRLGMDELLHGSVAMELLCATSCPILLIRPHLYQ